MTMSGTGGRSTFVDRDLAGFRNIDREEVGENQWQKFILGYTEFLKIDNYVSGNLSIVLRPTFSGYDYFYKIIEDLPDSITLYEEC